MEGSMLALLVTMECRIFFSNLEHVFISPFYANWQAFISLQNMAFPFQVYFVRVPEKDHYCQFGLAIENKASFWHAAFILKAHCKKFWTWLWATELSVFLSPHKFGTQKIIFWEQLTNSLFKSLYRAIFGRKYRKDVLSSMDNCNIPKHRPIFAIGIFPKLIFFSVGWNVA